MEILSQQEIDNAAIRNYFADSGTCIHGGDSRMEILSKYEISEADIRENLLYSPLFFGLSRKLQHELLAMGTLCRWRRNDCLFMDGDTVESVYYLVSGKIKEYYCNGYGYEYLRRVFYPGCYVSLHSVVNQVQSYTYSCVAVRASRCFVLPGKPFHDLLKRKSELCLKAAVLISMDYENSCRKICLCKKARAASRVAGYLLRKYKPLCFCALRHCNIKHHQQGLIDLRPLELAASDVCLTRETFSRALLKLQGRDIIRCQRGVVEILDEDALKELCGIE